jgi:lipid-binding SYLF domain-containing protein
VTQALITGSKPARRHVLAGLILAPLAATPAVALAATKAEIDTSADAALKQLYAASPVAQALSKQARAILIFPTITKAGFIVGGQGGDGVLRVGGQSTGYYRIAAGSVGLQVGAQTFSYALFLIRQSAIDYLKANKGWSIGSGPSIVIADAGAATNLNTTTLDKDVYAVPFGQKGLMAGIDLEGSKISPITPS